MTAKRGPPLKEQETESFQVTVPVSLHRYLVWLARHSMYGPTVPDVVTKILWKETHALYEANYHDKKPPVIDG